MKLQLASHSEPSQAKRWGTDIDLSRIQAGIQAGGKVLTHGSQSSHGKFSFYFNDHGINHCIRTTSTLLYNRTYHLSSNHYSPLLGTLPEGNPPTSE
jgi:hypothetical protein